MILLDQNIKKKKKEKVMNYKNVNKLLRGKQKGLNDFERKTFATRKPTQGTGFKILIPKKCFKKDQ